jgi:predicted dehydrogenase
VSRAGEAARAFAGGKFYSDPAELLASERLDFVDVVTQPASHRELVELAARHRVPVICQKPLAPTLEDACAMVDACRGAGVPFMVHENFRWQAPMRMLKDAASSLGDLFFGRISFRTGHDVYRNQPYLATDSRFAIYDLGVHLLDLARFFLGEVESLDCHARRVNPLIRAEDSVTMLLRMQSGAACVVEISFFTKTDDDLFPQTLVHLEGTRGSATLGPHFELHTVTGDGSSRRRIPIRTFSWTKPPHEAVQESVLRIQAHWLERLRERHEPETSGADNLKTLELVFGAYESAASGLPFRPRGT